MSQMLNIDVPPSYKKLVKMLAYALYRGECPPKDHQDQEEDTSKLTKAQAKKLAQVGRAEAGGNHLGCACTAIRRHLPQPPLAPDMQADTTGLGVVLLTALTERQWVDEDDLAAELKLHPKMVRRALRYLEQVGILA